MGATKPEPEEPARVRRRLWKPRRVVSSQTFSELDRRLLARWAATCAEHVLPLYEPAWADDRRVRDALARARAFAGGQSTAASEIRLCMAVL